MIAEREGRDGVRAAHLLRVVLRDDIRPHDVTGGPLGRERRSLDLRDRHDEVDDRHEQQDDRGDELDRREELKPSPVICSLEYSDEEMDDQPPGPEWGA